MKKHWKNIGLLLTVSFAVATFSSCGNNNEPGPRVPHENFFVIKAEDVQNAPDTVEFVQVIMSSEIASFDVIAKAPFQNNGFELSLPNRIRSEYMRLIAEDLKEFENAVVSSETASLFSIIDNIHAFSSDTTYNGLLGDVLKFHYEDNISTTGKRVEYLAQWIFVDEDVTVEASFSVSDMEPGVKIILNMFVDWDLQKGWNEAYILAEFFVDMTTIPITITITQTYTTTKPANAAFEWVFMGEGAWSSRIIQTKINSFPLLINENPLLNRMLQR